MTPSPKIAPKDQKELNQGPKLVQIKNKKDRAVLLKPKLIVKMKIVSLCKKIPKMFLNLTPTPKIAQEGPKSTKKAPNVAELKAKR